MITFTRRLLTRLHSMGVKTKCYGLSDCNGGHKCPNDHCFEAGDVAYRQGRKEDLRYYCDSCARKQNKI